MLAAVIKRGQPKKRLAPKNEDNNAKEKGLQSTFQRHSHEN
jgi:hypothetical protein